VNLWNKLVCLLFILSLSLVTAYPYPDIDSQAQKLIGLEDYETALNIDEWVEAYIEWEYQYYPKTLGWIWENRKGDCTEMAKLKVYMLRKVGIEARLVSGLADGGLHDWYEFRLNGKWNTFEDKYFGNLRRLKYGIW